MLFIGVDPGKTGAIAFIRESQFNTKTYSVIDMPLKDDKVDAVALWFYLNGHVMERPEEARVCIEKAITMPLQGARQRHVTGVGYGIILGVFGSLGLLYEEVLPAVWKKQFNLLRQDKAESVECARRLFPLADLHRRKDHGRAEALLLAWHARYHIYQQEP
jgi:crossover junction endodeoxyribonuclease RuvC